jgi:hypothetical protein
MVGRSVVVDLRWATPTPPRRAATISGRSAWFSSRSSNGCRPRIRVNPPVAGDQRHPVAARCRPASDLRVRLGGRQREQRCRLRCQCLGRAAQRVDVVLAQSRLAAQIDQHADEQRDKERRQTDRHPGSLPSSHGSLRNR